MIVCQLIVGIAEQHILSPRHIEPRIARTADTAVRLVYHANIRGMLLGERIGYLSAVILRAIIYEDAADADYEHNPYAMTIRQVVVTSKDTLHLQLARSGGVAVRIEKN
jgi:hypothetical protein